MKANELIKVIQQAISEYGDLEVLQENDYDELVSAQFEVVGGVTFDTDGPDAIHFRVSHDWNAENVIMESFFNCGIPIKLKDQDND